MRGLVRWFAGVAVVAAVVVDASDQIPGAPQGQPVALVGGTVHTVSGPDLENATVVFADGRITAVGVAVDIPEDARRIDVSGKHVYPGMLDAATNLGLWEIGAVRASHDFHEVGEITPEVRAEIAINPDSELIPVSRANGITTALTAPQGGLIAGTGAVICLDGWTTEDMVVRAPAVLVVHWPSMHIDRRPTADPGPEEQIERRDARLRKLREAFADARAYHRARNAAPKGKAPATDLRWEAMAPVLRGEVPVLVTVSEVRQVQAAIDWASDEGVRLIIGGSGDLWRAAGELAAADIPVIYWNTYNLPPRPDAPYDDAYTVPLRLHEAGVEFCIAHTGDPGFIRYLPEEAARAAAYGLPPEVALRAVTLSPARILGVDDRLGSIDVGKQATLVVTDGDLLEITTHVEREYIGGRAVDLTSRHTQLYDKYRLKYDRLDRLD